jgi:hypothetical protein
MKLQTILRPITTSTSNVMVLQVYTVPIVSLLPHTHVGINDAIKSGSETRKNIQTHLHEHPSIGSHIL